MKIYCDFLNYSYLNKIIFLSGWILNIRFHSFYVFFDLKDSTGIVQVIFKKSKFFFYFLRVGFYLSLVGIVSLRSQSNYNYFLNTGSIEIFLLYLHFLNFCKFKILYNKFFILNNNLFFYFLNFKNFIFNILNYFFFFKKFLQIDTPLLSRFFSEGSKVYIIPFRMKNVFFSLSQSPQIFKQLLMIFGFGKYYQISKCFRDENNRSDRNIEFIQFDFEISFINNIDLLFFLEKIFFYLIYKIFNFVLFFNFSFLFYNFCLRRFLTDKPDLRVKFLFYNFFFYYDYLFFLKGFIYIICLLNLFFLFGNNFKNYFFFLKKYNFNKNFFIFIFNDFYYLEFIFLFNFLNIFLFELFSVFKFKKKFFLIFLFLNFDIIFFKFLFFSSFSFSNNFLNFDFLFLFVLNFPIFNYNIFTNKYNFLLNPFSKIIVFDLIYLDINPKLCTSKSYDIVINGYEIAGGSVRNEKKFLQKKIFLISLNNFDVLFNFNFFLKFLKNSTPTHCGAAIGFERLLMSVMGVSNIKNISIFSRKNSLNCFFSKSPNFVF